MSDLYIDMKELDDTITDVFRNISDFISLEDFIDRFEEIILENEQLKEKIEELEDEKYNKDWIIGCNASHEERENF